MYQPISAANFPLPIMVLEGILLSFAIGYFWVSLNTKSRKPVVVASISLGLMLAFSPLVPASFEKEKANQEAMENNIMIKFNDKFSQDVSPYLKDVEYFGRGGKYEGGRYFNLTYGDDTTQRVKFYFSDKTGEPRCFCVNIKDPKSIAKDIDKAASEKKQDPSLIVNDRKVMIASIELNNDLYKYTISIEKNAGASTETKERLMATIPVKEIMEISSQIAITHKTTEEYFNDLYSKMEPIKEKYSSSKYDKEAVNAVQKMIDDHRSRY